MLDGRVHHDVQLFANPESRGRAKLREFNGRGEGEGRPGGDVEWDHRVQLVQERSRSA